MLHVIKPLQCGTALLFVAMLRCKAPSRFPVMDMSPVVLVMVWSGLIMQTEANGFCGVNIGNPQFIAADAIAVAIEDGCPLTDGCHFHQGDALG